MHIAFTFYAYIDNGLTTRQDLSFTFNVKHTNKIHVTIKKFGRHVPGIPMTPTRRTLGELQKRNTERESKLLL